MLVTISNYLRKFIHGISSIFAWVYVLLIIAIMTNVTLRYGFDNGLILFEEIQWHLYAIGMMLGLSYAEITNSQVRVDVVSSKLKKRTQLGWDIFGIVCLVLPFMFVLFVNSIDYVEASYRVNEASNSPLGLPYRWLIKSIIPFSVLLLAIALLVRLIDNVCYLMGIEPASTQGSNSHGN